MGTSFRQLSALRGAARSAELRLRLNRTSAVASRLAPVPLGYGALALTYMKLGQPPGSLSTALLTIGGLLAGAWLVVVFFTFVRRPQAGAGALLLDHSHHLKGRVANALSFSEVPEKARTPFMQAAIADAEAVAETLSAKRAVPFVFPRELPWSIALAVGLSAISFLEVRVAPPPPPELPVRSKALVLTADDVEYFKDVAARLAESSQPEMSRAVSRFNQLILDIAAERISRDEVFRRLDALERELADASQAEKEAFDAALADRGTELKASRESKPLGDALLRRDLPAAKKELEKLAAKLREQKQKLSQQDLERLKKALEAASQQTQKREQRIESRRQELMSQQRRLLNKKKKGEKLSPKEAAEQKELERRLERLDREKREAQAAGKGLSGLDKELAEAAQKLMKEAGLSAKDLEEGAEQLNRTAQQQSSQQDKEQLKKRLEELRDLLRQQGQAGKEQMKRLLRFGQKARGQNGSPGEGSPPGQGDGKDQKGPITLRRGGSGPGVEIPGSGQPGMPGGEKAGRGDGPGSRGAEAGVGHDENLRGDPTKLDGQYKDVSAVAADTGEGTASAEVIQGAAQRGFVGRGYSKVYTDYRTVAEDVLHSDEVPAGYRFYVRRYFQLIRPRE
ncbi:MAG: hypothetical protein SFV15_11420 [Polyangiaceae bacterium]|nr:hypothetical protein [Polyangiaceae bacterium]